MIHNVDLNSVFGNSETHFPEREKRGREAEGEREVSGSKVVERSNFLLLRDVLIKKIRDHS